MNVLRSIKNEFIKFIFQKKFFVLLSVIIIMCGLSAYSYRVMRFEIINHTAKARGYSDEFKNTLLNMNYLKFAVLFESDFIYKSFFSVYLIFLCIIFTSILSEDYLEGTMKFSLVGPVNKISLMLGKLLFIFVVAVVMALFSFVVSLIIGYMFFGNENIKVWEFMNVGLIYMISVIPATFFGVIVIFLSLTIKNRAVVFGSSVGIALGFSVLNYFPEIRGFSPMEVISKTSDSIYIKVNYLIEPIIFSIGYILFFSLMIIFLIKREDITY